MKKRNFLIYPGESGLLVISGRVENKGFIIQEIIFGMLGGLALFIYGMNLKRKQGRITSSGLQPATVTPGGGGL